ncbi:MAG: DNA-processing protein DprA [Pseudomonadota bacterium]
MSYDNNALLETEYSTQYPSHAPQFSELNEDERRELWAALALRHTEGLGSRSQGKLVRFFGSAFTAVQAAPNWKRLHIPEAKAQSVHDGVWRKSAEKEWKQLSKSDVGIILWTSPQYPILLRHIYDPPILLFCKGDTSLLSNATISLVGSRLCSKEGQAMAHTIASELSRVGITVISGMAKGVDATAHHAALQGVGRSIGVLGTGLDICYPVENKKLFRKIQEDGLIVTEFSLGMRALPQNFPARNRIVSGLSLGVLVVEAAARSGSLITARLALEQNREVYAVPGPSTMQEYSGCHNLIRQGAHPVFHVDDILRDLASPLQHQLENTQCLNLMRKKRRKDAQQSEKTLPPSDILAPAVTQHAEEVVSKVDNEKCARPEQMSVMAGPEVTVRPKTTTSAKVTPQADANLAQLLDYLGKNGEVHIDTIAESLSLNAGKLSALLLVLEMSGQVRRLPGMRYMLGRGA